MSRGTHASRLTSEGMAFQGKMVGANQKASVNASLSRSQVRPPTPTRRTLPRLEQSRN